MDVRDAADRPAEAIGQSADSNIGANGADTQRDTEKRVVKLTAKAYAEKLERLQSDRKAKLNKASNVRNKIQELMLKGDKKSEVQYALDELVNLCYEAKNVHDSLMGLLPDDEKEKHEIWFKAKMIGNDELISDVKRWVKCSEQHALNSNGNDDDDDDNDDDDDVNPEDSVSNVASKQTSKKSACSGKSSSTSSARVKAEADRAALLARVAALKKMHALEEQQQQLQRKREQLELEALLAAFTAK